MAKDIRGSNNHSEQQDDQFLFSYESPLSPTDSYPSIPLPVAYYINKNCPEIVEKATMMLFESRSNTPNNSSRSTGSSNNSSLEPSPLRSMATSSQGLSLPQTFIGYSSVPNGSSRAFTYSSSQTPKPSIPGERQERCESPSAAIAHSELPNRSTKNNDHQNENEIVLCKSASIISLPANNHNSNVAAVPSGTHFRSKITAVKPSSPLVATHRSSAVGDDILANLEFERGKLLKFDGAEMRLNHTQSRLSLGMAGQGLDNYDAFSNFSEAFETESNFSSVSGIEEEMYEVRKMMTKMPPLLNTAGEAGLVYETFPNNNGNDSTSSGTQSFIQTHSKRRLKLHSSTQTDLPLELADETFKKEIAETQFDILRQKINLEEQVSALKTEIGTIAKGKIQLLETISGMEAKVQSLTSLTQQTQEEKDSVVKQLKTLTKEHHQWKSVIGEYQIVIDSKVNEIRSLKEDLAAAEIQAEKLNVGLEESKMDLDAKDGAVQGLKQKIAELHVQAQTLLNEKIHFENDISSLKGEKETMQKSKEWYVQQLHAAQETKNDLHRELINVQAEYSSMFVQLEQFKSDNRSLRQQLQENNFKTVKEKEVLMKHLENIEADMLEREAIFQQIEQDKGSVEEMIALRMKKLEEEQSKLTNFKLKASDLEYNFEVAQKSSFDLQKQLKEVECDKQTLVMELAMLRRKSAEQEITTNKLEQDKLNCEILLGHIQAQLKLEETKVFDLKREKTACEIGLASANAEKKEVNEALKTLQDNLSSLEGNFKHMHTELVNKTSKLSHLMNENQRLEDSIQLLEKQLLHQKLTFQEQTSKDHLNSDVHIDDLKKRTLDLEKIITTLKQELRDGEQRAAKLKESNLALTNNEIDLKRTIQKLENAKLKNSKREEQQLVTSASKNNNNNVNLYEPDLHPDNNNYEPEVYKLQAMMETNEIQFKNRIRVYESNIKVLTRKLKQVMKESKQINSNSLTMTNGSANSSKNVQNKDEISILEENKPQRTKHSIAIQTEDDSCDETQSSLTDVEKMMQRYRDQVEVLEKKIQTHVCPSCKEKDRILDERQQSILDLEKENGHLKGSIGGQESIKEQQHRLEIVLAEKDGKLAASCQRIDEVKRKHDQQITKMQDHVVSIEEELAREKTVAKDLRYQIFQEKREVKHLKHQLHGLRTRLDQSGLDGEHQKTEIARMRVELEEKHQENLKSQAETQHLQNLVKQSQLRAQCLEEELRDVQSRDPAMAEQMKAVSWHLKEKNQEIGLLKKQLGMMEQRCTTDKDNNDKQLQMSYQEMKELKVELTAARKEKFTLQANVSELKGALRSSVNMAKNLRSQVKDKTDRNAATTSELGLCIPQSPAPYDETFINSLLKQSLTLPESRPLTNLQACLNSLKQEMSVLQKELEKRTQN